MSGDVRLDAATLEWVAEQMERAQEGADHLRASYVRHKAREARSRPPALSDWVRACEGTGLGPMTMGESDDGWALFWGGDSFGAGLDGTFVSLAYDQDSCSVVAAIGFLPFVYRTPAELRAALEAIAREAPSSGAPS